MNDFVENRALCIGKYIVEQKATVRAAAKKFAVSKSTVHKDVSFRLKYIDLGVYREVRKILEDNKAERHIRGGMATKLKYLHETPLDKR